MQKNNTTGRYLGLTCIAAAVVDISYLLSILNDDYFRVSVTSSIYFVSIDVMLVCLLNFTVYFTKNNLTNGLRMALRLAGLYACFETVLFALNPFYEIALGYVHRDTVIARYAYQMKPLYWLHLLFTYALVAAVLALLIVKLCRVPRGNTGPSFSMSSGGIVVLAAVNGVFLYLPGVSVFNLLDYSICGYSLTAFLMYWCCFHYSTHGMLNRLKTSMEK